MDCVAQSLSLALLVCVFCVCVFFDQTHVAPLNNDEAKGDNLEGSDGEGCEGANIDDDDEDTELG